jgi:hypothetical protein
MAASAQSASAECDMPSARSKVRSGSWRNRAALRSAWRAAAAFLRSRILSPAADKRPSVSSAEISSVNSQKFREQRNRAPVRQGRRGPPCFWGHRRAAIEAEHGQACSLASRRCGPARGFSRPFINGLGRIVERRNSGIPQQEGLKMFDWRFATKTPIATTPRPPYSVERLLSSRRCF